MKKRLVFTVALATAMTLSSAVSAALPTSSIIIGDKAYDLGYITNNSNAIYEMLNGSNNITDIYYIEAGGRIVSLFNSSKSYASDKEFIEANAGINPISYYDRYGSKKNYYVTKDSNGNIKDFSPEVSSNVTVNVNAKILSGDVKFARIGVDPISGTDSALKPMYFKIKDASTTVKEIGGGSSDDNNLTLVTTDNSFTILLLSKDMTVLGETEVIKFADVYNKSSIDVSVNWTMGKDDGQKTSFTTGLGNINNAGLVAIDSRSEWIYYSNPADNGGIYKTNGILNTKISDDNAKFLNVSGNYIYYSNYSDGQKIYKVRTDGTGRRIVSTEQASNVLVNGEYIYYRSHSGRSNGNIKRISKDAIKSGGSNITTEEVTFFSISGSNIYFSSASEGNKVFSTNLDGSYRTLVANDSAKFVTFIPHNQSSTGNRIYYVNDSGRLRWVASGSQYPSTINVINRKTNSPAVISAMNITEDGRTIFYADSSDGNKIYKADLYNGSTIYGEKFNDDASNYINIVDGKVYYTKYNSLHIAEGYTIAPNKDPYSPVEYIYTSRPVTKPKQDLKIVSYDKVVHPTGNISSVEVNNIEEYLPDKVTAIMSDNSVRELLINWNLNVTTGKGGAINYTGTIVGYGSKVTLQMSLLSEPLDSKDIKVINNAGIMDDKIYITGNLAEGDIIRAYRDPAKTLFLGQGVATRYTYDSPYTAEIILSGARTLPDSAKYVYLTRTSVNSAESNVTTKELTSDDLVGKPNGFSSVKESSIENYVNIPYDPDSYNKFDKVSITGYGVSIGDSINFYVKQSGGNKSEIISKPLLPRVITPQLVEFSADVLLSQGFLEKSVDGRLYYTISNSYGESNESSIAIPGAMVLPLEGIRYTTSPTGATINTSALSKFNDSNYRYYYRVVDSNNPGSKTPYDSVIADLTDVSTEGWIRLKSDTGEILIPNGQKVEIVEAFVSGNQFKAYKLGEVRR